MSLTSSFQEMHLIRITEANKMSAWVAAGQISPFGGLRSSNAIRQR